MSNKETLILTVGFNAENIVNHLYNNNNKSLNFISLDNEKIVINTNSTKTIWYSDLKFQKTNYDLECYKKILLTRSSKFNEEISKYNRIIVFSFFWEEYSSRTLFEVLEYLKQKGKAHSVFVADYSATEKNNVKQYSENSLNKLKEQNNSRDFFIYDIKNIIKENIHSRPKTISLIRQNTTAILKMLLELN